MLFAFLLLICCANAALAETKAERIIAVTDSLRRVGKGDSALVVLAPVISETRASADTLTLNNLLTHKGRMLARLGRAREAEAILVEAVSLSEATGDSVTLCEALFRLGNAIDAQGRDPRAMDVYERLIVVAQAVRDTAYVARGNLLLGRRKQSAGAFDEAAVLIAEARDQFKQLNLPGDELTALFLYGLVQAQTDDIQGARRTWLESLHMARRLENVMMRAGSLNNLAHLEFDYGDPSVAADYWEKAHELYMSETRLRSASVTADNLGRVLARLGRYDEAESLLTRALAVARSQDYTDYEARLLSSMAAMAGDRGQFSRAVTMSRDAWGLVEPTQLVDLQLTTLLGLAKALDQMDSTQVAFDLLQQHLAALRPRLSLARQIQGDLEKVRILIRLGRHEDALQQLAGLEVLTRQQGNSQAQLRCLLLGGEAYRASGRPDSSLALLQRAARVWEAARSVPRDPTWREQRGSDGSEIYTALADLRLPSGTELQDSAAVEEVYDLLQRFKARTLLERMMGPIAFAMPSPRTSQAVSLKELQGHVLQEGEVLLDTFVGRQTSILFAVTQNHCRVVRLPGENADYEEASGLRARVEKLHHAFSSLNKPVPLTAMTRDVGLLLLGGVAEWIQSSRRVIFAPDGFLNLVPLGALILPVENGANESNTPLSTRCEVTRVPSATVLAHLRRRQVQPPESPRILALAGGQALGQLEGAVLEAQRLRSRFRGVDLIVDEAARTVGDDPEQLARYNLLHFAAHVRVDDQDPWRSAVFLGDGEANGEKRGNAVNHAGARTLRASQIAALRLPASLAVLSGCESAGGRVLSGEGVLGLTGAFLSAGVEVVVATLWPVADFSTTRFMDAFYSELAGGATVRAAVRQAQIHLRETDGLGHPFFWAPFIVVGDGEVRVELQTRVPWHQPWMIGTLIVLVVGTVWLLLMRPVRRRRTLRS